MGRKCTDESRVDCLGYQSFGQRFKRYEECTQAQLQSLLKDQYDIESVDIDDDNDCDVSIDTRLDLDLIDIKARMDTLQDKYQKLAKARAEKAQASYRLRQEKQAQKLAGATSSDAT